MNMLLNIIRNTTAQVTLQRKGVAYNTLYRVPGIPQIAVAKM